MTKKELAKQIKASRLYKLYNNPTQEISRDAPEGVNATGQATDRMMELQRKIKCASMRETDFPPELRNDADELRELIQTGIVTLFADSDDGEISAADFKTVFTPLVNMTEGMCSAMNFDDPDKMMSLRSMKTECIGKAFYRQLKVSLFEEASGRERMFALGKALSSFSTHLFIKAERGGHLPSTLIEEVGGIVKSLNFKAAMGVFNFKDELDKVRVWGLVEGTSGLPSTKKVRSSVMAPVTVDQQMPANSSATPKGLRSKASVKGPKDDKTAYKSGGGNKAEVKPPELDQSPGNPKDVPAGKDAKQDGKWMDGGNKDTIDKEKSATPAKEAVEFFTRIPKSHGRMEWDIRLADKTIGEAYRRVFLGGSAHYARIMASELATALNESDGIPGEGIEVEATDIFGLQMKVIEALNKVAKDLGQDRRFTIVG